MVWIETTVERERTIRAEKEAILALLMDVCTSGPFFPGVDGIDDVGEGKFRWNLTERRTLGSTFKGVYVALYQRTGDQVSWEALEGNMKVRGLWSASGPDGNVRVKVRITTELDAPVPKLLKKPATLFAEMEAKNGLAKQLEKIDEHLRRAG